MTGGTPYLDKQTAKPAKRLIGQDLLQSLLSLLGTARIYEENNRLLVQCVEKFLAVLDRLMMNEDEVNLVTVGGRFYLQQEKVIYQRNMTGVVDKMLAVFEERRLDGVCFYPDVRFASLNKIVTFARILDNSIKKDNPISHLQTELNNSSFPWIEIIVAGETTTLESFFAKETPNSKKNSKKGLQNSLQNGKPVVARPVANARRATTKKAGNSESNSKSKTENQSSRRNKENQKKKALRTYGYALNSLQDVAGKLTTNKRAGIGKAINLVQNMVDLIMEDDNILLGLSTIRDYDDYTFTHSVNVAILSLCLGQRIGLSRVSLERLGLSGLFHDLGKLDVPNEILNKPGKLDNHEFSKIQKHSLNSTRRIIRLRASYDKKAKILLAPFEHHLKYDLTGYPKTPRRKPISLFGRIVCIADVYDAITSPRIYRKTSMSQDKALGMMLQDSGKAFDPLLLKVFINMLGVYPVGTILKLDDNELGIVTGYSSKNVEYQELTLLLLEPDDKGCYQKGDEISLGPWNPESGEFNRPILESCHPAALGIQPAEFFM